MSQSNFDLNLSFSTASNYASVASLFWPLLGKRGFDRKKMEGMNGEREEKWLFKHKELPIKTLSRDNK